MARINTEQLTKLYYSIGEVAEMFDVNSSLIRFWEKEFPTIKPKKNKKGNRLFTVKDIQTLDQIYQLVKEQGYTLEGAKKVLKTNSFIPLPEEIHTNEIVSEEEVIERLQKIRSQLLSWKSRNT